MSKFHPNLLMKIDEPKIGYQKSTKRFSFLYYGQCFIKTHSFKTKIPLAKIIKAFCYICKQVRFNSILKSTH